VIIVLFVLFALTLLGKLYFVQIVNGAEYKEEANRQYSKPLGNTFDRGSIFFQDKDGNNISAATLKTGYILAINPQKLENPVSTYDVLSKYVDIDADDFFARASKKDDPYEEVARRVSQETADEIRSLDISGIGLYKEKWRFYPGNDLASHTLGLVAFKEDTLAGRYGIEKEYEDVLSRGAGELYINFFAEVFSGITGSIERKSITREGDVITTIEPTVQSFLEETLDKITEDWSSKQTLGVVINPKTGAIYAAAVNPSFDVNTFSKEKDIQVFSNPLIERVYEMGSTVKPLTMAAGLDSGAVTAETEYNDKGSLTIDGATFSNYDGKARGVVPMQEVLNQSLNTGVSFVVTKMGNRVFGDYLEAFGLGEITDIDLPNEVGGLIDNLDSPRDLEYATASFGQGIATTPIATIRALSALGNGGYLMTPHVVDSVEYDIGFAKNFHEEHGRQVIKESTSEEITRMLVKVVDDAMLGGTVKLKNYSIAAKTGTAQIPSPDGGYYDDRNLHSFFGYFPAYNPEFLVFLMTIEPKEVRYASQTLTHPFFDITKFLINYYEVAPDR